MFKEHVRGDVEGGLGVSHTSQTHVVHYEEREHQGVRCDPTRTVPPVKQRVPVPRVQDAVRRWRVR